MKLVKGIYLLSTDLSYTHCSQTRGYQDESSRAGALKEQTAQSKFKSRTSFLSWLAASQHGVCSSEHPALSVYPVLLYFLYPGSSPDLNLTSQLHGFQQPCTEQLHIWKHTDPLLWVTKLSSPCQGCWEDTA